MNYVELTTHNNDTYQINGAKRFLSNNGYWTLTYYHCAYRFLLYILHLLQVDLSPNLEAKVLRFEKSGRSNLCLSFFLFPSLVHVSSVEARLEIIHHITRIV